MASRYEYCLSYLIWGRDSSLVPIRLLNNLEKFLELTIVTRLSYMIEEHGLLLPRGAKEELRGDGLHLPFKTSQFNKNPNY